MNYPCIEQTLDLVVGKRNVRLWINQDAIKDDYLSDSIQPFRDFLKKRNLTNQDIVEFAHYLIPKLNAIQIRTKKHHTQHGVVVYLVSFEDPHG